MKKAMVLLFVVFASLSRLAWADCEYQGKYYPTGTYRFQGLPTRRELEVGGRRDFRTLQSPLCGSLGDQR